MIITGTTLGYIAGIVDGEGCISSGMNKHGVFYLLLTITMTHLGTIQFLADTLDLKINPSKQKPPRRTQYFLRAYGQDAQNILIQIKHLLITKRKQAELALLFPLVEKEVDEQLAPLSYRR